MPYISKTLKGTKVRVVQAPSADQMALLVDVDLHEGDSRGNALRVRDRTGWPVRGGFVLYELCSHGDPDGGATPSQYHGEPHFWNATPRGLWVDATPRPSSTTAQEVVLVESPQAAVPPPCYASCASAPPPLVIHAVEGLCNRLRATLSYRQVAHAEGRQLVIVWRQDDFCPGDFTDCFLRIPGVQFVRTPPSNLPHDGVELAVDTHPAIKNTPAEAHGYAALEPTDALRTAIAAQIAVCGGRYLSLHVRRTDLHTALPVALHTRDSDFDAFADSRPEGACIYVATDNAQSQRRYLERYGDACKVHARIQPTAALRQTPLHEAVVDMFVCAAATDGFFGSHGSSFSDAIRFLRAVRHGHVHGCAPAATAE
jgi:hypothetical protein